MSLAAPARARTVAWKLRGTDPWSFAIAWTGWVTFYVSPVLTGLLLKYVLDRAAPEAGLARLRSWRAQRT